METCCGGTCGQAAYCLRPEKGPGRVSGGVLPCLLARPVAAAAFAVFLVGRLTLQFALALKHVTALTRCCIHVLSRRGGRETERKGVSCAGCLQTASPPRLCNIVVTSGWAGVDYSSASSGLLPSLWLVEQSPACAACSPPVLKRQGFQAVLASLSTRADQKLR